ncbi:HEC/Ndc80p family-domain-containing protein [Fimicolochytrium jonesii]|uniref:HEC/Ndc80p family-domain-containing protein n=1 Tax=Fimicolochytrium jonesii TaxID=1396493 RepID=UPI0022FE59CF|nr:HEC/Ndc80p family-domain-containing protein [Fimicolochytrium jonesii]KAI8815759.1 HEC/Ndc80p family-domain-containing protein [Fimicolochytrium jonesii]
MSMGYGGAGGARPSMGAQRMSLAPRGGPGGGGIGGMAGGFADGFGGGRMSDARMSGVGRNMGSMSRRSSQYAGRPSTIGGAVTNKPLKDPRPIRDKAWQANAIKTVMPFLLDRGFNQPLGTKILQAPSFALYQSMFKFLYAQLDPDYVFQKKFEEEVPAILNALRYPFADAIKPSHFGAVGSMHTWPTLLATLTWMVELIECCEMNDEREMGDDVDFADDLVPEKIFFDFVKEAYKQFMKGDDNYAAMDTQLMDIFDRKQEHDLVTVEKLEAERTALDEEWKQLTEGEAPVVTLEKEGKLLQSDKEKFKQYILHVESKIQKFQDSILALQEDLDAKEKETDQLTAEKAGLQRTVDAQEISPADVDRMTAEREQLSQTLESVAQKMEEANTNVWEKEIALQKRMDQLERLIQEYNAFAYKLGILGSDPVDAELAVELELRAHASRPDQMVSLDLRNKAKPGLATLRTRFNTHLHKAQNESIALQETLDNLNWAHTQKKEELLEMEEKIRMLGERYREEQEQIGMENTASTEEIQQYERNLQRMKIESNGALIQSQQLMQKAVVEYEQVSRQTTTTRERQLNDMARALIAAFDCHQHVHGALEELLRDADAGYKAARERAEQVRGGRGGAGEEEMVVA